MRCVIAVACLVMWLPLWRAEAQPKVTLPMPKPGQLDALVPVMAHSARVVTVSDTHGLLAVGHWTSFADGQVSLIRLDAKGTPAASAAYLKLPKPAGLLKNKNYVTGMAFHPKLPILYAWQDIDGHYTNPVPATTPAEVKQFDHLCVYNLAKDPPELMVHVCRGDEFLFGQQGGALAVDPTGSYLYVPNLREIKNAGSLRFARFPLDADGLPIIAESKDPAPARIKKIEELNTAEKFSPPQITPIEYVHLFNLNAYGSGHCFVPIGKDAVIAGGYQGLMTWRPDDKHATLHGLPLRNSGHVQFAVHPSLPAIFATSHYSPQNSFFRAEHIDGYLTLLPKQYVIEGSKLTGPPAVFSKAKKLAVGGENALYIIDLDDHGFPTGVPTRVLVNCPQVRAMVYSERFERAYVGVEVSK